MKKSYLILIVFLLLFLGGCVSEKRTEGLITQSTNKDIALCANNINISNFTSIACETYKLTTNEKIDNISVKLGIIQYKEDGIYYQAPLYKGIETITIQYKNINNNIEEKQYSFAIKENNAPNFLNLKIDNKITKNVIYNSTYNIEIEANDKENDIIKYQISSKNGEINKTDKNNIFIYKITNNTLLKSDIIDLMLSDEYGNSSSYSINMNLVTTNDGDITTTSIFNVICSENNDFSNFKLSKSYKLQLIGTGDFDSTISGTPSYYKLNKISNKEYEISFNVTGNYCLTINITDSNGCNYTKIQNIVVKKASLSFIVYMASDNNLNGYSENKYDKNSDYSLQDITEILNSNLNEEEINVIIMGDFIYNKNYKNGIYIKNKNGLNLVKEIDSINTGDKRNLKDLLDTVYDYFPADNYILDMWGHGSGWLDDVYGSKNNDIKRAVGYDFTSKDSLDLYEVKYGIENSKLGKVDILYFDTCLMGGIEVAYQFKDISKYIIASPELTPGKGGYYRGILELLNSKLNEMGKQDLLLNISKGIIDVNTLSYKKNGTQFNKKLESYVTAVYDLSKVEELKLGLDIFSNNIIKNNDYSKMYKALNNSLSYGTNQYGEGNGLTYYVDLGSFLNNFEDTKSLRTTLENTVVYYKWQTGDDNIKENNTSGISIFIPSFLGETTDSSNNTIKTLTEYKYASKFGNESNWTLLLENFIKTF